MSDFQSIYFERLAAYLSVLDSMEQILEDPNHPEWHNTYDSFRRIAHSLKGSGIRYGFSEITETAGLVEVAPREEIVKHLNRLTEILKKTIAETECQKTIILIIEDDPFDSNLLETNLSNPHRKIFIAETGIKALQILTREQVSLILLDLTLPDADGRNLLATLREMPSAQKVPVIVLSRDRSPEIKTECSAIGAIAYFEKPFDLSSIAETAASSLQQRADFMAVEYAKLKGEPEESTKRIESWADHLRKDLSISVIELDHYNSILESYGQSIAEDILHRFYLIVKSTFRRTDHLDQSEEAKFIVTFANTNLEGAVRALDNVQQRARAEIFRTPDGENLQIAFSAGVAELRRGKTIKDTTDEANMFLQYVKSSGGNRILAAQVFAERTKRRIIIAEDDDLTASVVKHRLEHDGFEVLHFRDSASVLSAAAEGSISLFILDSRMPVMDGFELLKNIRNRDELLNVPVVMLGSTGKDKDVIRGFELGADDFVVKPFSPEELKARIHRLILRAK